VSWYTQNANESHYLQTCNLRCEGRF
jgi:hypothetical protein